MSARGRLGRFAGFFGAPLISLVTPLLLLPVLARTLPQSEWAAIAVGQSIGGVAQLLVAWGWPLYGPAEAAGAPAAAAAIARASLTERGRVLAVVAAPSAVVAVLLAPDPSTALLTVSMTVAGAVAGLSMQWYAAGVGRPSITVRYELVPRVAAVLIAAAAVPLTGAALAYPALLLGGSLVGLVALSRRELIGARSHALERSQRSKAVAMLTELAGGVYSAAVVAVATTVLTTSQTAELASADRIFRLATFVVAASVAALQMSVHRGGPGGAGRRQIRAVAIHGALGLVGGALLAGLGRVASSLLFGSALTPSATTFVWYGAAFAALALNASIGRHVLVGRGMLGAVLVSTVAGTVLGVPAIIVLGAGGAEGVALAVFLAEAVVLLVQCLALVPGLLAGRRDAAPAPAVPRRGRAGSVRRSNLSEVRRVTSRIR